jgi:DNA primase
MSIAKSTIQELTDRIDAVQVIGNYVRLEQRGGRYMGLCPFHTEKTPSFSVNPEKKLYHCFGCGKGGTVIGFVMDMDKLTFAETVETLAKRYGVPVAYESSLSRSDAEARPARRDQMAELYHRVAGSFHYFLTETSEGKPAFQYVLDRGISIEMLKAFRLGYAPRDKRWLFRFLTGKGYSEAFLASSKLFNPKDPGLAFFSHRLMFPIRDHQERVVAFGGRLLSESGPKYLNSGESDFYKKGQTLFALDRAVLEIRKTKEVFIAEGYMDVIALHQAGVTNAVAPLGTSLTDEQARLLGRWAEQAHLVFDADKAGRDAAVRAVLVCRRNGLSCRVAVPEGNNKDPADILKESGGEVLRGQVKNSMLDCEYLMFYSKSLFDISNAEGKTRAITFMFPYLEALDSDVSREIAMDRIAGLFKVDRTAIRSDFERRPFGPPSRPVPNPQKNSGETSWPAQKTRYRDELILLVTAAVHQDWYPEVRAKLLEKDFEDPQTKELFRALEGCYLQDEFGLDAVLARLGSEDLRNWVVKIGSAKEYVSNPERTVPDGIKNVTRRRLEK